MNLKKKNDTEDLYFHNPPPPPVLIVWCASVGLNGRSRSFSLFKGRHVKKLLVFGGAQNNRGGGGPGSQILILPPFDPEAFKACKNTLKLTCSNQGILPLFCRHP